MKAIVSILAAGALALALAGTALAQVARAARIRPPVPMDGPTMAAAGAESTDRSALHVAGGSNTSFMWVLNDAFGYRWDINSNGTVSNGTNNTYDVGMQMEISGSSYPGYGSGQLNKDANEVEIGPWQYNNCNVYRRIFINAKGGYCRWIDIFENNSSQPVPMNVRYYFNLGESVQRLSTSSGAASISEKDYAFTTSGANESSSRASTVHFFCTAGAKVRPAIQLNTGSDTIYYNFNLNVPPGKPVALCFFEAQRRPQETASKVMKELNLANELALVPAPLRAIILNMPGISLLLGDIELRRSDQSDLVSLRKGDEIRGDIVASEFAVKTAFGQVKLPAEQVLGIVSLSSDQDLVRLATISGQIISGELTSGPLLVKLAGGTELKIPAKGLVQAAYRVTKEKPMEVRATDSLVLLRRGERLAFEDRDLSFDFLTPHGKLTLAASDLASIETDVNGGLHRVIFRNGSSLGGLLTAEKLPLKLRLGLPLEVRRHQIGSFMITSTPIAPAGLAKLSFRNGDALYGRLTDAKWTIQGKFGDVEVAPYEVTDMQCGGDALGFVKATLRSGTKISGKLNQDYIAFKVEPGPAMKVFVGQIESIVGGDPPAETATQPTSAPASPTVTEGAGPAAPATPSREPASPSGPTTRRVAVEPKESAAVASQSAAEGPAADVRVKRVKDILASTEARLKDAQAEVAKSPTDDGKKRVEELAARVAEYQAVLEKLQKDQK